MAQDILVFGLLLSPLYRVLEMQKRLWILKRAEGHMVWFTPNALLRGQTPQVADCQFEKGGAIQSQKYPASR
jgi:hypothetical protein